MPNIDEHRVDFRTWVGVSGTMLGAFMAVLDIQITNASLRDITGGIAATQDEGSWVSTSYLIGEIITIPLTAWLSRVFSVRWYLLTNVSLFLIFSCLCGMARSLNETRREQFHDFEIGIYVKCLSICGRGSGTNAHDGIHE